MIKNDTQQYIYISSNQSNLIFKVWKYFLCNSFCTKLQYLYFKKMDLKGFLPLIWMDMADNYKMYFKFENVVLVIFFFSFLVG